MAHDNTRACAASHCFRTSSFWSRSSAAIQNRHVARYIHRIHRDWVHKIRDYYLKQEECNEQISWELLERARVVHKRADEQCSARSHPYEQTSSWLDEHEQSERFGVVRSLVRELCVGEDVYIYAIAIDKPKH